MGRSGEGPLPEAASGRAGRAAGAAWGVALWLFAWSGPGLPWREPADVPRCPQPREVASAEGHSVRVACGPHAAGGPLRGPARLLFGLGLDPNRADARSLEVLPGIGPARAAAIVAGRVAGPYASLEDLDRVPGIGPLTLRRAAAWLEFDPREAGDSRNR